MTQFLNWISNILFSQNENIIHFILIPACFIESAFLYTILMSLLNMNLTHKKNLLYTFFFSIIGVILYILIPAPFNTILYYIFVCFLLKLLLNVKLMKSFLTIIISLFIIASINLLIQKPYMAILNIDNDTYMNTPIYRILYLAIFYFLLFGTNKIIKKVKKTDFSIEPLDVLDKQTFVTIYHYIGFAFLCLIIELLLTAFYIDKIPVAVTIFNFCLIFFIFLLSLFILSRVITLETTKKSLQSAEEYNKTLHILHDNVRGFKHDFDNIVTTIGGYIKTNDMEGLEKYYSQLQEDCSKVNTLYILNPDIINNPGIYNLLTTKYSEAEEKGIKVEEEPEITIDINISSFIPDSYIENTDQKMESYRNIAVCRTQEDFKNIQEDLTDRFGKMPQEVINLIEIAKLKENCKNCGIIKVIQKQNNIILYFEPEKCTLDITKLVHEYNDKVKFSSGIAPYITYKIQDPKNIIQEIGELLKNVNNE